jgi:hypothetical protein
MVEVAWPVKILKLSVNFVIADGISLAYIDKITLPTVERTPFIPPKPSMKPSAPSKALAKPSLKSIKKLSSIKA